MFEEVKVGSPSWLREGWGALPWHLGLEVGGMEQGAAGRDVGNGV